MPVTDADEAQVIQLLLGDVAATLGGGHEDVIRTRAAEVRTFVDDDPEWYTTKVVEDVQQYFHDCFIDTTWPRCPLHPHHPLWLQDGRWYCEGRGVAVARLGELRAAE